MLRDTYYTSYTLLAYYCCTTDTSADFLFNLGGLTSKKKRGRLIAVVEGEGGGDGRAQCVSRQVLYDTCTLPVRGNRYRHLTGGVRSMGVGVRH